MNRPIKFRVWDGNKICSIKTIDWDEGGEIEEIDTDHYCWSDRFDPPTLSRSKVRLMQFTGLLDKNGKEIYEGDTLIRSYGALKPLVIGKLNRGDVFDVEFFRGQFLMRDKGLGHDKRLNEHAELMEIIGNIYENPELLPL